MCKFKTDWFLIIVKAGLSTVMRRGMESKFCFKFFYLLVSYLYEIVNPHGSWIALSSSNSIFFYLLSLFIVLSGRWHPYMFSYQFELVMSESSYRTLM